jgi:hypothetical protein
VLLLLVWGSPGEHCSQELPCSPSVYLRVLHVPLSSCMDLALPLVSTLLVHLYWVFTYGQPSLGLVYVSLFCC